MRQIVLDTETTGLESAEGHRIIEIGCVELVDRRLTENTFHEYLNPEREVDQGALDVHGLSDKFLADKPRFAEIADEFLKFVDGSELIIHNAGFDTGFINSELKRLDPDARDISERCTVLDTLELARRMHPGQKNSLDALCKRYNIDNSGRQLHGALLDAQILADVYLAMTGGQAALLLDPSADMTGRTHASREQRIDRTGLNLSVLRASEQEREMHRLKLESIARANGGKCLWRED
ncbi:MAG TPA: DNA polymerase III subunit epsilon [Gammaproteobacteria bacterium]|jgi:DNA polymerase-3 subunit epsilon|nr:DNA polymerase III subunit epsilon [Gammaproteobacteria bacterium]